MKDKSALLHQIDNTSHWVEIADTIGDCFWIGDKDQNTLYVNPKYEEVSGYSLEECLKQPSDFCFDEKSKKLIQQHHKLRAQGKTSQYQATMIAKSGENIPVSIIGAATSTGGSIAIFSRSNKPTAADEQEQIADHIIKHSSDAIVFLDKERNIKLWSHGATRLFGYSEQEAINKSIDLVIPAGQQEQNEALRAEVNLKGHIRNIETIRLDKNGDLIDVRTTVSKIKGEKGELNGYLVLYKDIRNQKRINNELQKRFETIQDAYKELGVQRRYLDYLCEITETAVDNSSIEELERLIVSAFSLITKSDSTILRICDKSKQNLKLRSCFGVSSKWNSKDQVKTNNSIAEEAFRNRRALIINDVDTYQKHQGTKLLKAHKLKALILLPLFIENNFIGSISLYSTDPAKFRLIETDFLERMGKQASLALFSKYCLSEDF